MYLSKSKYSFTQEYLNGLLLKTLMEFITPNNDDTVNGRPETAAFDAVLGRSLTEAVLASRVPKPTADSVYCHPRFVLVVPGAWTR